MGEDLLSPYSLDHYLQKGGKLQAYDLLEMLILNLHFYFDDDHHLTSSSMGYMKSTFDASPWKDTLYLFFFLHYDDVLKVNVNALSISFFKTYSQYGLNTLMTILRISP